MDLKTTLVIRKKKIFFKKLNEKYGEGVDEEEETIKMMKKKMYQVKHFLP